jgi:3-hydroxyisobutyrate dehydrogenase
MKVGWIGLGVMGGSMCAHLVRAGYPLTVHTRTRAKAAAQLAAGAAWADSPRAVAQASDVVFTMVGFPRDVREVVLAENGVLAGLRAGGILVDMTTSEPALAIELADAARARGAWALDTPVSGGDVGAREARLSIMVGGNADALAVVRPALETLGPHDRPPRRPGHRPAREDGQPDADRVEHGRRVRGTALRAARGARPERVLASVSGGAAGSWSLANLAPRMLAGDYAPGFYVEHFVKDMAIALREAERMKLTMPGLALAKGLYELLVEQGHARSGTQALVLALAKLSAAPWPPRRA